MDFFFFEKLKYIFVSENVSDIVNLLNLKMYEYGDLLKVLVGGSQVETNQTRKTKIIQKLVFFQLSVTMII